jgi:hypothetical protein
MGDELRFFGLSDFRFSPTRGWPRPAPVRARGVPPRVFLFDVRCSMFPLIFFIQKSKIINRHSSIDSFSANLEEEEFLTTDDTDRHGSKIR